MGLNASVSLTSFSYRVKREGTMKRERALKVVMVLLGLLFVAGAYPIVDSLRQVNAADRGDMGDDMMSLRESGLKA
jgi:hypothetical protein